MSNNITPSWLTFFTFSLTYRWLLGGILQGNKSGNLKNTSLFPISKTTITFSPTPLTTKKYFPTFRQTNQQQPLSTDEEKVFFAIFFLLCFYYVHTTRWGTDCPNLSSLWRCIRGQSHIFSNTGTSILIGANKNVANSSKRTTDFFHTGNGKHIYTWINDDFPSTF